MGQNRKSIRVGVFRHTRGNIGHSFMDEGLRAVLDEASTRLRLMGFPELEPVAFEQHQPFSYLPIWHPDRWLNLVPQNGALRWRCNATRRLLVGTSDRRPPFDLSIGMPGPIIVQGMAQVPQVTSMMRGLHQWGQRWGLLHLELAVGSSFPLGSAAGSAGLTPEDRRLCTEIFSPPTWTSSRDAVTDSCLADLGISSTPLPDIAFAMPGPRRLASSDQRTVLINLQRHGANATYGRQTWSQANWRRLSTELIRTMDTVGQVRLLANNAADAAFLQEVGADHVVVTPPSVSAYLRVVREADLVVATRVHASVAACSQGVPSIGLGNDSRLGVLERLGVPTFDSVTAKVGEIAETGTALLGTREALYEEIMRLKRASIGAYVDAVTMAAVRDSL